MAWGRPSFRVIFPLDGTHHAAHQTDAGAPEGRGLHQEGEKLCVELGGGDWGAPGSRALSPDEGGSEVGAACSCPRAEMTCREGCSSEVWRRSDCARGLHLGWRKSNKEVPGEPSGPCRDKLDRAQGRSCVGRDLRGQRQSWGRTLTPSPALWLVLFRKTP